MLSQEPYKYNKGSKERGETWTAIADTLNKIPGSGLTTTQRGVRTQYDKLMDEFLKNEKEEMGASGIEAEYDELEPLLLDVYERSREAATTLARQLEEKEKTANDERQQITDVRTQAMERQANNPIKRKSTVLKELIEEGRIAKNELETKRMALEEKRLQADKEKQELFADIVAQQQQQQAFLIEQQTHAQQHQQQIMKMHLENQAQQQTFQQQQQKLMAELHVQNSQVQLELLKVLRDIKDK